jgi:hypothetical protein
MRVEGLGQLKNPMTSSGIELAMPLFPVCLHAESFVALKPTAKLLSLNRRKIKELKEYII